MYLYRFVHYCVIEKSCSPPIMKNLLLIKLILSFPRCFFQPITHCVKFVRIRSYSGPHFSRIFPNSDGIRRDTHIRTEYREILPMWIRRDTRIWTEYGEILRISPCSARIRENAEKMRTKITPNTDTFLHSEQVLKIFPL